MNPELTLQKSGGILLNLCPRLRRIGGQGRSICGIAHAGRNLLAEFGVRLHAGFPFGFVCSGRHEGTFLSFFLVVKQEYGVSGLTGIGGIA